MIYGIIAMPFIFINGNRGTILIAVVSIVLMILINGKDIRKKIVFVIIIIALGLNITNIVKGLLDFA